MTDSQNDPTKQFFEQLGTDYTRAIERCVPRYREMLWTILSYLPSKSYHSILELGCGSGNLSILTQQAFPEAKLTLVDFSPTLLNTCRERLIESESSAKNGSRHRFLCEDFRELNFAVDQFDLVVSSIAIHHLHSESKRSLFKSLRHWLSNDGTLCFSDQFRGDTETTYERHIHFWKLAAREQNVTESEWDEWIAHQDAHDFHDSLRHQLRWLEEAGFENVDCVWRYLLWTVIQAS